MTEIARFLKDLLLHPELRRLAYRDLDAAARPYALSSDELELLRSADARLLDAIGEAVREEHAPERPAAVERIHEERPVLLDEARLWLRLAPFQRIDGSVHYSVGIAGSTSPEPPSAPALHGNPLPVVDLDITVQPTLNGAHLSLSSSLLPRGGHLPAPQRARRHRSGEDPLVEAAVKTARESGDPYQGVLDVIDALLTPGGLPWTQGVGQAEPDVTILGTGMVFPDHVTVEAEAAIRRAREVLVVDTGVATLDWLRARCPIVTPLVQTAYVEGDTRLHTYHHFVASAVVAALDHSPVVFAMSGHPLVSAYAPFLLADTARAFGLTVGVQPGISSLAALLAVLEIDPLLTGLQLHEATDLLLQRRPMQPDLPAMILQVGTVGTLLHTDRKRSAEAFVPLRDHLIRFYGPGHRVRAVYVSPHPWVPHAQHEIALQNLCELASQLHAGYSLWVPAATDRPLGDAALAAGLSDPDALLDQVRGEHTPEPGESG